MSADPAGSIAPTSHAPSSTVALTLGSVGVVYGDIGTSPIYALREGLRAGTNGQLPEPADVISIVSLLLWLLILIATFKYVILIMRADNRGEGGTLSLLALCQRAMGGRKMVILALGILGTSLFFGDAMITPAISVLSAVEGITLIAPHFDRFVIPVTLGILIALFWAQRHGTARISRIFGPVMLVWFILIAGSGIAHIKDAPGILRAFNPAYGIGYLVHNGQTALPVIGSVFLAITGAEALYADMGHFGRKPIRLAWAFLVFPSLALAYLGQGAMVMSHPETAVNPFFLMMPEWALPAVIALATVATVIASQAVITGAYSVGRQAIQLGLLPRMEVRHTSETERGQIFVPRINTILLFCVTLLVIGFGSSEALATAYGIAVTGEMLITTVLAVIVFRLVWKWNYATLVVVMGSLFLVELFLFAANLTKFAQGGYLPISVAAILAFSMWTWVTGTSRIQEKSRAGSIPLETLIKSLEDSTHLSRAPGTAVFLTAEAMVAPPALLHNLKHNGVLHSRNFIVSVRTANRPHVPDDEKIVLEPINDSFTRVRLIFGYMDDANVPKALRMKVKFDVMSTSFFLNRRSLRITDKDGMWLWQKRLFLSLFKMATNAHDYYRLPSNRVVELGQQIAI